MSADTPTGPTPQLEDGRRLDRTLIVQAAVQRIDRHGAQGLTMRTLAHDLRVEAMSLYSYIDGREDLLEAVTGELLDGLRDDVAEQHPASWQRYLQVVAHATRRIATEHPAVFPLIATRHPAAPWLRPPLRSLELVEDLLTTLSNHGFTDTQIVETYRAFSSFLLGQLLLEAAVRGAETSPVEEPLDEGDAATPNRDGEVDLRNSPTTTRMRTLLSEDHSAEEFDATLSTLLDRLTRT